MTARIFLKLISGVLVVLIVVLLAVDFLATRVTERAYIETLTRDLASKSSMMQLMLRPEMLSRDNPRFRALARSAGGRLTAIGRDGKIIADSEADATTMENHASRAEVAAALKGSVGSETRRSGTLGLNFLYVAIPAEWGALRLAVPLENVEAQVTAIRRQLMVAIGLAFLPAVLVAALFARSVSSRLAATIDFAGKLAHGDFQARLQVRKRDEFGVLAEQLNETGEKLRMMFEALQREHEQLEQLEQVRKDFVINVSHELRTPLASIQGYTETLLDGAIHDPEHNIKFLSIIRQNAERLGRLTGDLMTLSRLELKSTKFQFAIYSAGALIEECVDSLRPLAEKKQISVTIEPIPERAEVHCDAESVHQIMGNLVENAVKYTPDGGKIAVGARFTPDQQHLEIFIRDTGIGIPGQDLPRLFERFYRVDKARSRELGGTGLGLAIVKHLVRAQGGDVRVESEPNRGSTFSFTLPVPPVIDL